MPFSNTINCILDVNEGISFTLESKSYTFNKKRWLAALLIAFLAVLIYLPCLDNSFVNWDDPDYVYENIHIRSLDSKFLKWMFTTFRMQNWHPMTWLSHGIDYAMWGLNPTGHHLTSVILHALNTFLVVIIAMRLLTEVSLKRSVSLLPNQYDKELLFTASVTGLLFALHPIHVESVAWVSERKDVLFAFFSLLSILSYLSYTSSVQKKKALLYILSQLFFILALMSKPMAVTLPGVLLILDIYPLERLQWRSAFNRQSKILIEKIPFLLLSCFAAIMTLFAQQKEIASFKVTLLERIALAFKSLIFYLFKIVWPIKLAPLYPYPSDISFISFSYVSSLIFVAGITIFCIWSWKRHKVFLAVWLYYVCTLLPVLGIIKVGQQAEADRYMYLPSIGPMLLMGLAMSRLWNIVSFDRKRLILRKVFTITFMIAIISILSVLTIDQIKVWRDSVTLWSKEIQFYSNPTAHVNRGNAYIELGKYQQAIDDYNKAIQLDPLFAKAYVNRGIAYSYLRRYQKALQDFSTAISLDMQNSPLYFNRGNVFKALGLYERAIEDYTSALALNSDNVDAYNNRGTTYLKLRKLKLAIKDFTSAIKRDPENDKAYANRGIAFERHGEYRQAINDYKVSARLGNREAQKYLRLRGIEW